jgi:hypothetical protein
MSLGRKTITYAALAGVLAAIIILGSIIYVMGPGGIYNSSSQVAGQSVLAIQLTDPPQVPVGTRSLNLTYSAVNLLVGEPASHGQVTTSTISLTPPGGTATVDLLKLQNVSRTVASTNLPTGSMIYSISFTVQSIAININGTVHAVALAMGGTTLGVTLAHPATLDGDSAVLLELNPVVADTPTGYQLIPSLVGFLKPHSEFHQGDENVGTEQGVSQGDHQELHQAGGQVTSRLVSLSVSGNVTSFTVQINNTGSIPVTLVAIGLHGNFTSQSDCPGNSGQHGKGDHGKDHGGSPHSCGEHNEVVFSPIVPTTTTTTTSSSSSSTTTKTSTISSSSSHVATCSSGQLELNGGQDGQGDQGGLVMAPGECLNLAFSGSISFGQSAPIVPSTQTGQVYLVHVIASNDAQMMLGCTLPLTATSCTHVNGKEKSD